MCSCTLTDIYGCNGCVYMKFSKLHTNRKGLRSPSLTDCGLSRFTFRSGLCSHLSLGFSRCICYTLHQSRLFCVASMCQTAAYYYCSSRRLKLYSPSQSRARRVTDHVARAWHVRTLLIAVPGFARNRFKRVILAPSSPSPLPSTTQNILKHASQSRRFRC